VHTSLPLSSKYRIVPGTSVPYGTGPLLLITNQPLSAWDFALRKRDTFVCMSWKNCKRVSRMNCHWAAESVPYCCFREMHTSIHYTFVYTRDAFLNVLPV
jgi:hypothetical protein